MLHLMIIFYFGPLRLKDWNKLLNFLKGFSKWEYHKLVLHANLSEHNNNNSDDNLVTKIRTITTI